MRWPRSVPRAVAPRRALKQKLPGCTWSRRSAQTAGMTVKGLWRKVALGAEKLSGRDDIVATASHYEGKRIVVDLAVWVLQAEQLQSPHGRRPPSNLAAVVLLVFERVS